MNITERKQVEDHLSTILEDLTRGEKAILYKTLYAEGFKISDCDEIIRQTPPPSQGSENKAPLLRVKAQVHLSRGWPMNPRGWSRYNVP